MVRAGRCTEAQVPARLRASRTRSRGDAHIRRVAHFAGRAKPSAHHKIHIRKE